MNHIQVVSLDRALSYSLRVIVYGSIGFRQGESSTTISSPAQQGIPQGAEVVGGYALRASAGQTMRVSVASPNHHTYLTIVAPDGAALKYYDDWALGWEGVLPATQEYYLLPVSVGADPRFTLTVWVSPLRPTAPTRIRFAPGATSGQVSGSLTPGVSTKYVLWAARGQRLEVRLWPPPCRAQPVIDIAVAGQGGHQWRSRGLEAAIGPLPISGDYTISLTLQPGSRCSGYLMQVTIPAL
jgi:hypothetical protein